MKTEKKSWREKCRPHQLPRLAKLARLRILRILFDLAGLNKARFSPVVPEVVLSSEGLVADITGIWPLVRVCPLMDQKVVGFGKMAATELADKLFLGLGGQSASAGLALR